MKFFTSFRYITQNNIKLITIIFLIYLIWDGLIFGAEADTFLAVILFQLILALISISSVGSFVLRFIYGVQDLSENHRAFELFDEVYENVKEKFPDCPNDIKIYLDRDMTVNAYAIGNNTIVVNRGTLETLNDDHIRGILAHEFGHLIHKDTSIPLFLLIGNMICLIYFAVLKLFEWITKIILFILPNQSGMYQYLTTGVQKVINLGIQAILFIIQGVILINQRKNEFQSDSFAYEIDYGDDLLGALRILDKMDLSGNRGILERIKASHPYITDRIMKLENLMS